MAGSLVASVVLGCLAWLIWQLRGLYPSKSPLDDVPGPKRDSFLTGNMRPLFDRRTGLAYQQKLCEDHGPALKIHGLLGTKVLYISDSKALQHIFREYSTFIHAPFVISSMMVLFGPGLLSTEGAHHRKQRKLLNPVFTSNVMRELTPLMFDLTSKLRDAMLSEVGNDGRNINVEDWMVHAALEGIGRVGLGHSFVSFHDSVSADNHIADVVKRFAPSIYEVSTLRLAADRIERWTTPGFRRFVTPLIPSRRFQTARYHVETLHNLSREILEARKLARAQEGHDELNVISIFLKAIDEQKKSDSDELSEEELIAQIRTLIFAAVDTTSNSSSRILHLLAGHADVQDRLRGEIKTARDLHGSELSYDQLNELPLLDAVCRETLRLHTAVNFSLRYADQDAIIPLSSPIHGPNKTVLNEIVVPRGTEIILNWHGCNRDKAIWGEDALEWKPKRWSALPQTVLDARLPGIMSNLMSFGGGSHSCIGYRFAMLEIKTMIFAVVGSFKLSLTNDEVFWNYGAINFPTMSADSSHPNLVLHVEPVQT